MKWTISKEVLLGALTRIQSVIEKKNTMEILGNTLFDSQSGSLSLAGTDLEVGIQMNLDAQIQEPGKLTLSTKHILDITRELPNQQISFVRKPNQWVELTCGRARFNLVSLAADGYPALPAFDTKNYVLANSERLSEMIDKTQFAVSTDATRYHMNGVFLEILEGPNARMTATDGHRLSFVDSELFATPIELKRGAIIPKKGLTELHKMISGSKTIGLAFERGYLYAKTDQQYLFIRLIEADYVPYKQVIPNDLNQTAKMNREELLSALKRVSLMAHEKSKGVKFSFQDGLLTIASSNPDMGEARDEISIEFAGTPVEIGFNATYVMQCLEVMSAEWIDFKLKDKTRAGLIQGSGQPNHSYVIMPMRI